MGNNFKGVVYPLEGMSPHLSIENARIFLSAGGGIWKYDDEHYTVYEKNHVHGHNDKPYIPRGYITRSEYARLKKLTPYLKNDKEVRKIRRTEDFMRERGALMRSDKIEKYVVTDEERRAAEKAAKAPHNDKKKPVKYFTLDHAQRANKRGAKFLYDPKQHGYWIISTDGITLGFICVFSARTYDKSKISDDYSALAAMRGGI